MTNPGKILTATIGKIGLSKQEMFGKMARKPYGGKSSFQRKVSGLLGMTLKCHRTWVLEIMFFHTVGIAKKHPKFGALVQTSKL